MSKHLKILFFLFILYLCGCATVPSVRESPLPTYTINGVAYLPIGPLCNSRGINWEYDTFARSAVIKGQGHVVNLRAGETMVLVDDVAQYLSNPVETHEGALVVPYKFKEKIFDNLFKTSPSIPSRQFSLTRLKTIVVDAGHGGKDPGTTGRSGIKEKDINLDVARRLAKLLKDAGVKVVLTRSNDSYPSLERRVNIANNVNADLFISIHSNANRVRSLKGFEVYYVSAKANDSKRALASAKEATLDFDRSCFAGNSLNLRAVVWDLLYTYNRAESVELARSICHNVNRDIDVCMLGVKNANFFVLRGARMPAILVEIGFLSNAREEKLLRNGYYRQQIAESLVRGIEDYEHGLPIVTSHN